MSLATAEILFKRDGNYRLDRLRASNGHHGLDFAIQRPPGFRPTILLENLSAKVLSKGTFPVWHGTAVGAGIFAMAENIIGSSKTSGFRQFSTPGPLVGDLPARMTLRDLVQACPAAHAECGDFGLVSQLARGSVNVIINQNTKHYTIEVIIHPAPHHVVEKVLEHFIFAPSCADIVQPVEFPSGGGFKLTYPDDAKWIGVKFPLSYTLNKMYSLLSTEEILLNEFGIYYIASYISGMFARYYPEHWARCVESANTTYQAIDSLMAAALRRTPLLLLGELRDRYYIIE